MWFWQKIGKIKIALVTHVQITLKTSNINSSTPSIWISVILWNKTIAI